MIPYVVDFDHGDYSTSRPQPSWILDKKEEARIRHRRRILEERTARIHLPRATSIAVDVEALKRQVKEKEFQKQREIQDDKEYEEMVAKLDKFNLLQEFRAQKEEESLRKELCKFWKEEQRPERRREYDLNSSQHRGDSGYDIYFVGEDEDMKERIIAQRRQMRDILLQQMEEERLKEEMGERQRREENKISAALSERAKKLAAAEELCRNAENFALFHLNQNLAKDKKQLREWERQEEDLAIETHIHHALNSTLLTEDERVARSVFGPHRVLCDRWKGMNEEQKLKYHKEIIKQIAENENRRRCHENLEKEYQKQATNADLEAIKIAQDEEKATRQSIQELELTNAALAEEQKRQGLLRYQETATNAITDDFFDKFGIYPR